ncbi:MAG: lytic transglycosylase F, partial [Blastocatellia bacterium]|nr:lytic transglycosylase F [Blastocatellia bacterium]
MMQAAGGRIFRLLPQTLSSAHNLVLSGIAIIAFTSAVAGCRQHAKKQDNAVGPEGEASATKSATDNTVVPEVDLDATEMQMVKQPWFGDFNELGGRRYIRALVVANETAYFVDRGEQRGYAYELLAEFEKSLRSQATRRHIVPKIAIIPTTRDRLLPALAAGYAEIAIGNLTITPRREQLVDFSDPILDNVKELVVSGPSAPPFSNIDELSGKEVYVRASSSYHDSLKLLNHRFHRLGKAPVKIRFTEELFEDEDIMQEVDAGIIPITVVDSHIAKFWSQIYDRVIVHDDLALREGGRIAWAMRKNTPEFMRILDEFVRTHRAGTLFGNIMLMRYLGSADHLKNPLAQTEMQRFRDVVGFFRKYGDQYDLPWLLIAAMGYQESGLNQSKRSPDGAVGIMQVKPSTAADPNVGIRNIQDRENNIHAGVKYLRFIIDQFFTDEKMDRLNKGLFALASYNAGPARVAGLRQKANVAGLDPNKWFNNVEFVAAREIGRETVDYVSNIYKYYIAYRGVVEVNKRRS